MAISAVDSARRWGLMVDGIGMEFRMLEQLYLLE